MPKEKSHQQRKISEQSALQNQVTAYHCQVMCPGVKPALVPPGRCQRQCTPGMCQRPAVEAGLNRKYVGYIGRVCFKLEC